MSETFNAASWLVDRHVAAGGGDRIAVRSLGSTYSYSDVQDQVHRAAAVFAGLGVGPEQRVLPALPDGLEFVSASITTE